MNASAPLFTRSGVERVANDSEGKRPIYRYMGACNRCGGSGRFGPECVWNGRCFECSGLGKTPKIDKLYSAAENEKLDARRDRLLAAKAAKAAAELALRRAPFAGWMAVNGPAVETALANLSALERASDDGAEGGVLPLFAASFKAKIDAGLPVSDRALDVVVSAVLAKLALADLRAASAFVGVLGKRVVMALRIEKIIELGRYTYGSPMTYLFLCRDDSNNRIVYKGSAWLTGEGGKVMVKATVSKHDAYNGENQTVISRPAVLEQLAEAA